MIYTRGVVNFAEVIGNDIERCSMNGTGAVEPHSLTVGIVSSRMRSVLCVGRVAPVPHASKLTDDSEPSDPDRV